MTPAPSPTVLVVAHTHWDREWYHTAERFRQRLVALIDELLDDPPADHEAFLLDGQAVLLEDYLAVRPERAADLSALLHAGRIEAGPWFVLSDELIPGGEALVRNLLAGRAMVERLGGTPPPVLYCPDSFGHPAILPELADGFGCAVVVLWRGYGGARWPSGDTVRWLGPSGASVVLYHLPPDGYEFGSSLPTDARASRDRWAQIEPVLRPRATTGVALLFNGADHHARQHQQSAAITQLQAAAPPATVRASSLRAAADALVRAASSVALPAVTGELRDSYGYTWTLGGTLGTRAAQKRRNALAERALVRDVEPWVALGAARRADAARPLLDTAWRDLLRAHPHDTLCGTSIDTVAVAFDHRLATVESQIDGLRRDGLQSLVTHDAEVARLAPDRWRPALVLRNPVARTRSGVAEVVLTTKIADVAVGPGSALRQGEHMEPDSASVERMGVQHVSTRRVVELTESPRAYPDADLVEEVRGLFWVESIGGYVVDVRTLDDERASPPPRRVYEDPTSLDNGLLRVDVDGSGAVRCTDLATGRKIDRALAFELARDVGDLYTPAIRETIESMRFVSCALTQRGPLRSELLLHYADGGRASLVDVRLQLDASLGALRVSVTGANGRSDVRLRLVFGTGVATGTTIADAAFHTVERKPIGASGSDTAMEAVVRTAPLHRFVSRYDGTAGVTIISDGLAEYEVLADGAVAVTLLRAVGELSRADLPERPGHAGWPAATPAAQSHGPFEARFAIALHGRDSAEQRAAVERLAEDVLLPIVGETLRSNLGSSRAAGGLELEGDGLAFSAALPARAAGWIVLRCINRTDRPVAGSWRLRGRVAEACLVLCSTSRTAASRSWRRHWRS
jgi:alpha-mannosidase